MPSFDFTPPNTGTTLSTMAPNSVRKLWSAGLLMAENNADFFSSLESASNKALIRVKTDTAKGKGQKITFTNMSGFYDEPHHGDEMFESPDDFEEIQIGDFELTVDWIRHATSTNERMEEVMGMRGEIESGLNVQLGEWLGRQKSEKLFAEFMLHLNTENVLYAGGKTLDTLGSADTLAWDEIVNMGYAMKPLGGLPANIAAAGSKAPIWSQLVIPTEAAMLSLKLDADYKQVQREAGVRGGSNELFKGGVVDIDGHSIMPYNPIDHDGIGAIGSFLNPKAQLGTAITAGTGTFDITGGGNATNGAITKKHYFKYFPGFAYKFSAADTYSPASETRYVLIVNPPNAATDPGKVGMYSYTTGNNGNKITIVNRLGSAASGARVTTLGGVTWDTGVWAGKHTDVHPSNATIVPCNSKGVPIGDTLMLGRMAVMRGYGKYRGHRSQDEADGGFVTRRYITSVFGQTIRKDRLDRHPAVMRLRHAVHYPQFGLPTVS